MTTELERYEEAVTVALAGLAELAALGGGNSYGNETAGYAFKKVNAILHPEPQYEEVEIVRWMCKSCRVVTMVEGEIGPDGNYCCKNHVGHLRLAGVDRRAIPQPVERSEKVMRSGSGWMQISGDIPTVGTVGTVTWADPQ